MIVTPLPQFLEAQKGEFGQSAVLSPFSPRLYLGDYGEWQESGFRVYGNILSDLAYTKTPRSHWIRNNQQNDYALLSGGGTFIGDPCYEEGREGSSKLRLTAYLSRPGAFLLHHWKVRYETLMMDPRFLAHLKLLRRAGVWNDHFRLVCGRHVAEQTLLAYTLKGAVSLELSGFSSGEERDHQKVQLRPEKSCFFKLRLDGMAVMEQHVPAADFAHWLDQNPDLLAYSEDFRLQKPPMEELSNSSEFVIDNKKTAK